MSARLDAIGVSHAFDARRVLDGIDLAFEPGTVTAILGPNGVGKTTLLRILAGLLVPTAGAVKLDDQPLGELPRRELARRVGVVLRAGDMAFDWTVLEVVLMGRAPHLSGPGLESEADRTAANHALTRVGAEHLAARVFPELSAGEQQRVLIARALCQDTPVLLLDEPTSHLDPAHALAVAALFRELAGEGRTVACILHDLNLAARCADVLVFLLDGRIAAAGPPAEVLVPDVVRRVYGVSSRRVGDAPPAVVLGDNAGQKPVALGDASR